MLEVHDAGGGGVRHEVPVGVSGRALHAARNSPLLASVLARRTVRGGAAAGYAGLRVAPAPLVRVLTGRAAGRRLPVTRALALAARGEHRDAVAALHHALAVDPGAARARGVAAAAAALGRAHLAEQALLLVPAADRRRPLTEALVAEVRGEPGRALAVLGTRHGRYRRELAGDLAAIRGDLLGSPAGWRRPPRPVPTDRPVRVLHVVTSSLPEVQAGSTLRTQGLAAAQRARGVGAHVVTRVGFPVDVGRLTAGGSTWVDGVPYHRLLPRGAGPTDRLALVRRRADELVRLARALDADVLHAHTPHDNAQAALLAGARLGRPVVYEVRGFLEETWRSRGGDAGAERYRLERDTEARCMAAADAVVVLSGSIRDAVVERGVDPARVHLVPNAVDASWLTARPDGAAVRRRWGIPRDALVVGTVSTLNDYEGVDTLLAAAAEVDDPRLVVLVVGDGPARSRLVELASRRGVRAVFTGRVPHEQAADHHAAIDVFCVPRTDTPVTGLVPPLKPLEAMALGRPVLASDLPPLRELVEPGRAGLLLPPGDPRAWAAAVAGLLADPGARAEAGGRAREWVASQRTWAAVAALYDGVYGGVGRRGSPFPGQEGSHVH